MVIQEHNENMNMYLDLKKKTFNSLKQSLQIS